MVTKSLDDRWNEVLIHPVIRELNPEGKHFLRAHKLSLHLNQYASRFSMYALTICGLPHLKVVPAFSMMACDFCNRGAYEGKHTIVVPSSGNTAHAVARLAPAFGFKRVIAVMADNVPPSKSAILRALSVDVRHTARNTMEVAQEEAEREGCYLLDQYNHPDNASGHETCTGPAVVEAFGFNYKLRVLAVPLGSAGTLTGVSRYLKDRYPETKIIGVRPALGQQVPGVRDAKKMASVIKVPWREQADAIIENVSRKRAFTETRQLWSEVEPQPGPSSGLAYLGLIRYLDGLSNTELEKIVGKQVAFICPDNGYSYSDYILGELDVHEGFG